MPKLRVLIVLVVTTGALLLTSCRLGLDRDALGKHQGTIDEFFERTTEERKATFSEYSFDEKYAIYIYGSQVMHPPTLYLARAFAAQGRGIVLPLSKKLDSADNDLTIRDIVRVFAEMENLSVYDVTDDKELMDSINSALARIESSYWKQFTRDLLLGMRTEE